MPSTYSANLRLELMATGENANTWGQKTNNNLNLLGDATNGYLVVSLGSGGNTVLTANDAAADQTRQASIEFNGALTSAAFATIIGGVEGTWNVRNSCGGAFPVTFRVSGGTGIDVAFGESIHVYSDGTSVWSVSPALTTVSSTQITTNTLIVTETATVSLLTVVSVDAGVISAQTVNVSATLSATTIIGNGAQITGIGEAPVGQCRLTLSGANLLLSRQNGRFIFIDTGYQEIPSGGVTLAPSGLTPSTTYYIYAFMATGTMTLDASTTVPISNTVNGVMVKTGDTTRTLVGMARPITGPAWVSSLTQRLVVSWFNQTPLNGFASYFSTTPLSTTTFTVLPADTGSNMVEFLTWANNATVVNISSNFNMSGNRQTGYYAPGFDGSVVSAMQNNASTIEIAGILGCVCLSYAGPALTEGYHLVQTYAHVDVGQTLATSRINLSLASYG